MSHPTVSMRSTMSFPVMVLLTTDSELSAQFHECLTSSYELHVCATLQQAATLLQESSPQGCVADFRSIIGGGHAEARFLEVVREASPALRLAVLSSSPSPEPVDRYCTCHDIPQFHGRIDAREVAEALAPQLPKAE